MTQQKCQVNFPTRDVNNELFTMKDSALRNKINSAMRQGDLVTCLLRVGELHGHLCPGLALGILSAITGLQKLGVSESMTQGMEDLLAVVETNACFTDGIQYISCCTLGNNALVYRDYGKTAVTFAVRSSSVGVRVRVLSVFAELIEQGVPQFYPLMDKVITRRSGSIEDKKAFKQAGREAALHLLQQDKELFLAVDMVTPDIPPYAPITDTSICSCCGEPFMSVKGILGDDGQLLCRACGGEGYYQVEGIGIVHHAL